MPHSLRQRHNHPRGAPLHLPHGGLPAAPVRHPPCARVLGTAAAPDFVDHGGGTSPAPHPMSAAPLSLPTEYGWVWSPPDGPT